MHKILFLLLLSFSNSAFAKLIVISDIDDTIRLLNRKADYLEQLANAMDPHLAFRGMSPIYQALSSEGAEIHYVTAAISPITELSQDFLEISLFPQTHNFHFRGWFEDKYDFKVEKIREILSRHPHEPVLLIGDNGEKDVAAYATIAAEFPKVTVYIHKLFEGDDSAPVPPSQNLYLTGADLALQLEAEGILSAPAAYQVVAGIRDDLRSQDEYVINLVLPYWAEVTEMDIQRAYQKMNVPPHEIQEHLLFIEKSLFTGSR